MESVVERFLRYVTLTPSRTRESDTCPSTEKQKTLAAALVEEMHGMGIAGRARMDENGYVYGTVPGDPKLPHHWSDRPHGHRAGRPRRECQGEDRGL